LAKEFSQSLKQVKIRAAAYEMKRPDRTFTNLSKNRRESETSSNDPSYQVNQAMARIIKANNAK